MKAAETVRAVAAIASLWPTFRIEEHTCDTWHLVLADLEYADVEQAIVSLARSADRAPSAATLRREVARLHGLLSPDEDQAFMSACHVASAEGIGRKALPVAVREAYDAVGGAQGIRSGRSDTVRAQFREAYRAAQARVDRDVVGSSLQRRIELESDCKPALTRAG